MENRVAIIGAALVAAVFSAVGGVTVYFLMARQCNWSAEIEGQVSEIWEKVKGL